MSGTWLGIAETHCCCVVVKRPRLLDNAPHAAPALGQADKDWALGWQSSGHLCGDVLNSLTAQGLRPHIAPMNGHRGAVVHIAAPIKPSVGMCGQGQESCGENHETGQSWQKPCHLRPLSSLRRSVNSLKPPSMGNSALGREFRSSQTPCIPAARLACASVAKLSPI